MNDRAIDFYVKGLPFDIRQGIFQRLDTVGVGKIEKLLEKNIGYPRYKSMGYNDEQIANQERKSVSRFKDVNDFMIENERYPLFSNPEDTYQSATEYVNLLKKKTKEELAEEFGCSWEEYVPKKYPTKTKPSSEDIIFE